MAKRSLPKGAQARRRVLDAVVDAVAQRGLANLSVAEIGAAAGMSDGHVLYYFGTKDTLFVEALKHVEAQLDPARAALTASTEDPRRRLRAYLALYLPTGPRDPRWALWVEVWDRSLTDPDLRTTQLELDARWQHDLTTIIQDGIDAGHFHPASVTTAAEAIAALLDGLAIRTVTGDPGTDSSASLRIAEASCALLLAAQ
jgi:AcrR family transcriptional regulator